jgi:hypothetical protein
MGGPTITSGSEPAAISRRLTARPAAGQLSSGAPAAAAAA